MTPSPPSPSGASFEVSDDPDSRRFLLRRDGELIAFANYSRHDEVVVVPHVETLIEHRGNGFGAMLVDGLLDMIRAEGRRIVPLCSFAADHIEATPRHHDLLT